MAHDVYDYQVNSGPLLAGAVIHIAYAAGASSADYDDDAVHYAQGPYQQALYSPTHFTVAFGADIAVTWLSTADVPLHSQVVFQFTRLLEDDPTGPDLSGYMLVDASNANPALAKADLSNVDPAVVTPFALTLLNDATAAAARATLGVGTGSGDVAGPVSSTANHAVLFDGTTGKLIKSAGGPLAAVALSGAYADLSGLPTLGSLAALSTVNGANWSGQDLAIADGGTGASTAAAARTNLGLGTAAVLNTGTAAGDIPLLTTGGKLPAVDGSLLTNLTPAAAASPVRAITGADTIVAGDKGKLLNCTSASAFTLAVTACATLGDGFFCDVIVTGAGTVTIDANASEVIATFGGDLTTIKAYQRETLRLVCNGTKLFAVNRLARVLAQVDTLSGGASLEITGPCADDEAVGLEIEVNNLVSATAGTLSLYPKVAGAYVTNGCSYSFTLGGSWGSGSYQASNATGFTFSGAPSTASFSINYRLRDIRGGRMTVAYEGFVGNVPNVNASGYRDNGADDLDALKLQASGALNSGTVRTFVIRQ